MYSSSQTQEPTTTMMEGGQDAPFDFLHPLYLIFGLTGIFSNGLVIFVFIRVPSLRNATNLLIGNQSLIDLMSSVFLLLSKYMENSPDFSQLGRGLGLFVCYTWTTDYLFWSLVFASTANLMVITLDRYLAIMKPLVHRQRVNLAFATKTAIASWVIGLLISLYWPALYRLQGGACYVDFRHQWIQVVVGTMVTIVTFVVPTIIIIMVYSSILRKLRNKVGAEVPLEVTQRQSGGGARGDAASRDNGSSDTMEQKIRSNVLKTMVLVAMVFIICWGPNQILYLMWNLGWYRVDYDNIVLSLSLALAFCNMWINPFIYTFKYRKFQHGLRQVFSLGRGGVVGSAAANNGTQPA